MGEVPDSLPLTDETGSLRAQANQLARQPSSGSATCLRSPWTTCARGDPRLPLELALVKVTRPAADLERESIAYRLEQLESRGHSGPVPETVPQTGQKRHLRRTRRRPHRRRSSRAAPGGLAARSPAVEQRSIPTASMLREAHPSQLADDRLTVEFPAAASFHRQLAEEPKNATLLAEALYEVTGRKLALDFAVGENGGDHQEAGRGRRDRPTHEGHIRRPRSRGGNRLMSMDMNKMLQQGSNSRLRWRRPEELAKETVEASAGGGMVTVKATGGACRSRDQDLARGDRPDPGAASRHGARRGQRGASRAVAAQSKLGGMAGLGDLGGLGLPGDQLLDQPLPLVAHLVALAAPHAGGCRHRCGRVLQGRTASRCSRYRRQRGHEPRP